MKRRICICIVTAIIIFSLNVAPCFAAENTEKTDSLQITDEEYEKFSRYENNTLIKLYNGTFMSGFAERLSIEELIDTPYCIEVYYMVVNNDIENDFLYVHERNGKITAFNPMSPWELVYKNIVEANDLLSKQSINATVKNIYCLNGEPSHDGVYIYYVTDRGDYVYYKDDFSDEKEYLFPVKDFYTFADAVNKNRTENGTGIRAEGKEISIEEINNAEKQINKLKAKFEIKANNPISLWVYIALGALMLCLAVILVFTVLKKKKRQPGEM